MKIRGTCHAVGWSTYVRTNPSRLHFFQNHSPLREQAPCCLICFTRVEGSSWCPSARVVLEDLAPGQVEFIPVELNAAPTTWRNSLADAYYSIRDLGRIVMATFAPDRA